jgi:hypothetical protein
LWGRRRPRKKSPKPDSDARRARVGLWAKRPICGQNHPGIDGHRKEAGEVAYFDSVFSSGKTQLLRTVRIVFIVCWELRIGAL